MNYTELRNAIKFYTNNYSTEFDANIDTIIRAAEIRVNRDIDLRENRRHSTANMTPNDPYLSLPSNVLQVRYLRIRSGDYIEYRPESFMSEFNKIVTTAGTPKYYGHWDSSTLVVAPAPSSAFIVELSYKINPTSIVSATTTWLSNNAEDVLLYACLVDAGAALMMEPNITAPYVARYEDAKKTLQGLEASNMADEYMARSSI